MSDRQATRRSDPKTRLDIRGNIFVVAAPSGAGKTTLVHALVERMNGIALTVSHTTRRPRDGEVDGMHYHFVSRERFEHLIEVDRFLEHAKVFGNYYGTSIDTVEDGLNNGDVLLEIDWQGAQQIKQRLPDAIGIFILPPSRETLEQRLRRRGKDSDEVIARRLAEAQEEMSHHDEFDYLVVNDDLATAVEDAIAIVRGARMRQPLQAERHAELLSRLLA